MRIIVLFLVLGLLGCARVKVEAPKEPIKVDISMRLDIYQHIQKDIDAIENIVSGHQEENNLKDNQSSLHFLQPLYAQDLDPQLEQSAINRKNRYGQLSSLEAKGIVGENKSGLVEIKDSAAYDISIESLVKAENDDRMVIYRTIAQKNNSSVEEVQKMYAKRLQQDAPSGTPIEVWNESNSRYEWQVKCRLFYY